MKSKEEINLKLINFVTFIQRPREIMLLKYMKNIVWLEILLLSIITTLQRRNSCRFKHALSTMNNACIFFYFLYYLFLFVIHCFCISKIESVESKYSRWRNDCILRRFNSSVRKKEKPIEFWSFFKQKTKPCRFDAFTVDQRLKSKCFIIMLTDGDDGSSKKKVSDVKRTISSHDDINLIVLTVSL